MPRGSPSLQKIINAWNDIGDHRWIVRRNKEWDSRQWEVVHDWGGECIDEATQKLLKRFETQGEAEFYAADQEALARALQVATMITEWNT